MLAIPTVMDSSAAMKMRAVGIVSDQQGREAQFADHRQSSDHHEQKWYELPLGEDVRKSSRYCRNGSEPVKEYIDALSARSDKDSRIKLNKILDYMKILSAYGTRAGEPYIKHIEGDIWELRPLRDRIFFFGWNGNRFILLHSFTKKSQKTPQREIEQARKWIGDFIERSINNE